MYDGSCGPVIAAVYDAATRFRYAAVPFIEGTSKGQNGFPKSFQFAM
jgi:hypothetical protein